MIDPHLGVRCGLFFIPVVRTPLALVYLPCILFICAYLTQFHETHYCYGLSRLIRNLLDCGFSNFFLLFLFLSHPI